MNNFVLGTEEQRSNSDLLLFLEYQKVYLQLQKWNIKAKGVPDEGISKVYLETKEAFFKGLQRKQVNEGSRQSEKEVGEIGNTESSPAQLAFEEMQRIVKEGEGLTNSI